MQVFSDGFANSPERVEKPITILEKGLVGLPTSDLAETISKSTQEINCAFRPTSDLVQELDASPTTPLDPLNTLSTPNSEHEDKNLLPLGKECTSGDSKRLPLARGSNVVIDRGSHPTRRRNTVRYGNRYLLMSRSSSHSPFTNCWAKDFHCISSRRSITE